MSAIRFIIDTDGEDIAVEFTGTPKMEDDGIGHYEFWGAKGYDSHPYLSCENTGIEWEKHLFSDETNKIIEQYLDDNFESINIEICENYSE